VNGKKPLVESIEDLILSRNIYLNMDNLSLKSKADVPDIWVFNFQEIVPLSAKSMMVNNAQQPLQWEKYLQE